MNHWECLLVLPTVHPDCWWWMEKSIFPYNCVSGLVLNIPPWGKAILFYPSMLQLHIFPSCKPHLETWNQSLYLGFLCQTCFPMFPNVQFCLSGTPIFTADANLSAQGSNSKKNYKHSIVCRVEASVCHGREIQSKDCARKITCTAAFILYGEIIWRQNHEARCRKWFTLGNFIRLEILWGRTLAGSECTEILSALLSHWCCHTGCVPGSQQVKLRGVACVKTALMIVFMSLIVLGPLYIVLVVLGERTWLHLGVLEGWTAIKAANEHRDTSFFFYLNAPNSSQFTFDINKHSRFLKIAVILFLLPAYYCFYDHSNARLSSSAQHHPSLPFSCFASLFSSFSLHALPSLSRTSDLSLLFSVTNKPLNTHVNTEQFFFTPPAWAVTSTIKRSTPGAMKMQP